MNGSASKNFNEDTFERQRERMVSEQLARRNIHDERVLDAMRRVPRHSFVRREDLAFAYADGPLQIGEGQTISQPYIVALMTQMLGLMGHETVLEIGTGSGYQAAVLAQLTRQVHTIERHPSLAENARRALHSLGYTNVQVHIGDGSLGLPEHAPYQAILVTAAAPQAPQPLLEQLDEDGCLVLPVGGRGMQTLERWQRQGDDFKRELGIPVAFVPLRGMLGWHGTWWEPD
jgi:protein-L-isoaspartate(D-aspartate) O-methyltransferase